MVNTWLPNWVGVVWAMVFAVIVVAHVWHIIVTTGRHRLWHCAHVLMALGMIVMFIPTGHTVVSSEFGEVVFGVAATAVVGLLVADPLRGGTAGRLWMVTVVDLAAMVYMFAMMTTRLVWLTIPLVIWFVLQATGWATGRLYTAVNHGGLGASQPRPARALGGVGAARRPPAGSPRDQPHQAPEAHSHDTGSSAHRSVISITLALMALGMAYMLVAMQFGMSVMGSMPGM